MLTTRFLAIASVAASLVSPALGATAISAEMSLTAEVQLGWDSATNYSFDEWRTPLSPLAIDVNLTVADNLDLVTAHGVGDSRWISANAGSVSFEEYSYLIQHHLETAASVDFMGSGPDWSYTFVAGTGDVAFKMAYDVVGYGHPTGWGIYVQGGPEGLQLWVPNTFELYRNPTISGVFVAALTPGETYTAYLQNEVYVLSLASWQDVLDAGSMNGNFHWEVTSVPEPQSYVMLSFGLGLIAGITRLGRNASERPQITV